jgi:hypothetical protein
MMVLPLSALSVVGAASANATPVTARQVVASESAALPLGPSVQVADESAVSTFLAANPVPAAPSVLTPATIAASYAKWDAFLKVVPWTAIYGQWGCTVKAVTVTPSTAATPPTFGVVSNCGGAEALTPLVGTFATRTATLATPAGAAARSLYASESTESTTVTPLADQEHCAYKASTYLCIVWNTANGIIAADAEWEGSGNTPAPAHSRLGDNPGPSCGLGTFVANSPAAVMAPGDLTAAEAIEYVNSDWSDRFYDTAYYSSYCAVNA